MLLGDPLVCPTHIESAPVAATVGERLPTSAKGATAMKSHAIHCVALNVHQATTVASVRDERGLGRQARNPIDQGSSAARSGPRLWRTGRSSLRGGDPGAVATRPA